MSEIDKAVLSFTEIEIRRFWENVDIREETECWEWRAYRHKTGYGQFSIYGGIFYSHRVSCILFNGIIEDGKEVRHSCNNPACCNPKHLIVGTHKENMEDMVRSGRSARGEKNGSKTKPDRVARGDRNGSRTRQDRLPRGAKCPNAKLTDEKVLEMRALYAGGGITYQQIADQFGLSLGGTWQVINGQRWKHLNPDFPLDRSLINA